MERSKAQGNKIDGTCHMVVLDTVCFTLACECR
jgi:hypothetical protein